MGEYDRILDVGDGGDGFRISGVKIVCEGM